MAELLFLQGYNGQTVAELTAMKGTHQIASLVMAIEEAVSRKPESELTEAERVVLAVEEMEREVNNGGFSQFFTNSSARFASVIAPSLELIDCPKSAEICKSAVATLSLPATFDEEVVRVAAENLDDEHFERLNALDAEYFSNDEGADEGIARKLFEYVEAHQGEIRIPHSD